MGSPPARTAADQWEPGTWNIRCSLCGKKLKFNQARQHWQGMYRCTECWEPRPQQDFVHSINSKEMAIPYALKETDVDTLICTFNGISAVAGLATAGCMLAGRDTIDILNIPTQLG